MRILVTGVTGFAGGHLAEALLSRPHAQIYGVSRRGEWPSALGHLQSDVELSGLDLCDRAATESYLRYARPDQIYHLAGYASVGQSFHQPSETWESNLTATLSLYTAIQQWGESPRIVYVGSGLVYGDADSWDEPLKESCLLAPGHPYASSKAASDLLSFQFTQYPGVPIIRARPFNHIGPRQSANFAIPHFAKQIVTIRRGEQGPVLKTGNLGTYRDFTDVRDIAQAYISLMTHGGPGEAYNIASEISWSVQEILNSLLEIAGLDVEVRQESHLMRAKEESRTRASAAKLRNLSGWVPTISIQQSLADILQYWEDQSG